MKHLRRTYNHVWLCGVSIFTLGHILRTIHHTFPPPAARPGVYYWPGTRAVAVFTPPVVLTGPVRKAISRQGTGASRLPACLCRLGLMIDDGSAAQARLWDSVVMTLTVPCALCNPVYRTGVQLQAVPVKTRQSSKDHGILDTLTRIYLVWQARSFPEGAKITFLQTLKTPSTSGSPGPGQHVADMLTLERGVITYRFCFPRSCLLNIRAPQLPWRGQTKGKHFRAILDSGQKRNGP
ncbi:hypothetical protein Bbelb_181730 [Branchiostoma belcheri]|nr:hypothetical protein Bbelb_181730 [Branchiostoma belcheri]